jgi:hypothetical protein
VLTIHGARYNIQNRRSSRAARRRASLNECRGVYQVQRRSFLGGVQTKWRNSRGLIRRKRDVSQKRESSRYTRRNINGGANFKLPSDMWFRMPVAGWHTWNEERVRGEGSGNGVAVESTPESLAAGVDTL